MQSSNGDTDTENRLVVYTQGKERVEQIERPYVKEIASGNWLCDPGNTKAVLCDHLEGWEVGGRFKREGTYVYLWLIHADVWQKSSQYYKEIIL